MADNIITETGVTLVSHTECAKMAYEYGLPLEVEAFYLCDTEEKAVEHVVRFIMGEGRIIQQSKPAFTCDCGKEYDSVPTYHIFHYGVPLWRIRVVKCECGTIHLRGEPCCIYFGAQYEPVSKPWRSERLLLGQSVRKK